METDCWGKGPPNNVARKLRGMGTNSTAMPIGMLMVIVDVLFPNHSVRHEEGVARPVSDVPEFTEQEHVACFCHVKKQKSRS